MPDPQPPTVAQVFDALAPTYDQTGVAFFAPVADELVRRLAPAPGERCLDVGCGRGAATLPLAAAVGPTGHVLGVDVSAGMLEQARGLLAAARLDNVTLDVADAGDLGSLPSDFDVVAASLVIFFLSDPAAALRSWMERLAPGGRIGLVTFAQQDDASRALNDLLTPYAPPGLRDPVTAGPDSPFASDAGMERLLVGAGATDVSTAVVPTELTFADPTTWQRFSLSTGQRAMWMHMPEEERPRVLNAAAEILEGTRDDNGPCRLVWQMRYTLGART